MRERKKHRVAPINEQASGLTLCINETSPIRLPSERIAKTALAMASSRLLVAHVKNQARAPRYGDPEHFVFVATITPGLSPRSGVEGIE